MVRRLFQSCLLRPEDVRPSRDDLEVIGTFNPAATLLGDETVLLVRVAERLKEKRPGMTALPRCERGKVVAEWVPNEDLDFLDPRLVRRRRDGLLRLTFVSHLLAVRSKDGRAPDDVSGPRFFPAEEYEEFGLEDPRLTPLDGGFYFTYVAVSRHGAATALAFTKDFRAFERRGIIFCPENKDVVLFPEKIDGEYFALHRPTESPFTAPEMWTARSPDLRHWGAHECLFGGAVEEGEIRVGAGAPPFRVEAGWLELYHGSRRVTAADRVGVYAAGALLLDAADPRRILKRTAAPLLAPAADFEREGFVPNVVFPTGVIERGEVWSVYYGAADTATGVVELSRREVLEALR